MFFRGVLDMVQGAAGSGEAWYERLTTCGLPYYLDGEMPIKAPPAGVYVATEFWNGQEHQEDYPCEDWFMQVYWVPASGSLPKYNVTRYRNAKSGEVLWSATCSSNGTKADADAFQARHPELVVDYSKLAEGYTMDSEPANDALKHIDEIPDEVLEKSMPDVADAIKAGIVTKDYLKDVANKGLDVDYVDAKGTVVLKPKGYPSTKPGDQPLGRRPDTGFTIAGFNPWLLGGVAAVVVGGVLLFGRKKGKGKSGKKGRR